MNTLLDSPLTDEQIKLLYTSIDKDADGFINYNEFLTAFNVVQSENN